MEIKMRTTDLEPIKNLMWHFKNLIYGEEDKEILTYQPSSTAYVDAITITNEGEYSLITISEDIDSEVISRICNELSSEFAEISCMQLKSHDVATIVSDMQHMYKKEEN